MLYKSRIEQKRERGERKETKNTNNTNGNCKSKRDGTRWHEINHWITSPCPVTSHSLAQSKLEWQKDQIKNPSSLSSPLTQSLSQTNE